MGVKCLGVVTVEPAGFTDVVLIMHEVSDEKERNRRIAASDSLKLGKKRYVPITDKGEIDQSEDRSKVAFERSKKEPQLVNEISESTATSEMMNRLWLYDGKLYQSTRNDYTKEQIHLLILEFLDKEKKKFQTLEDKFKELA